MEACMIISLIALGVALWAIWPRLSQSDVDDTHDEPNEHAYKVRKSCKQCEHELTNHEIYYSDGVCPYCGNISGSTIINYKKEAIKNK